MPNSVTRNFPLTVKNISLAASPFLNNTSPWRYLRWVINGLSHSIDVSPCSGVACLLDEVEHLTEANSVDRQQQEKQKKGSNVTSERAKSHEKHVADHVRDAQRHHGPRQQRGDKEGSPDQSTHIGNGDVSEEDFQKAIEDGVVRDVVGIEPELNENFCEF